MTPRSRPKFRRWAAGLFDQQLWCWGRDISRPEGNVLLEIGMCRHRSPESRLTSLYKATLEGDAEVWLWGFGLLYGEPGLGCVFLRRYGFDPMLMNRPPEILVHRADDLGPLVRPLGARRTAAETLVRGAAKWIAGYEHWVAETLGIDYRRAVLEARGESPAVPAQAMASSWERLVKKSFRLFTADQGSSPWDRLLASLRHCCDSFTNGLAARRTGRHSSQEHHQSQRGKQWRRGTRTRGPT